MARVRPRIPDDLPALVSVLVAVHRQDGYPTQWPADPVAWLDPPGIDTAWVASDPDGPPLGHVALAAGLDDATFRAATGRDAHELANVKRLFVDPDARGRGVARLLLDTVVAEAAGLGLHAVLDVVDSAAPAIHLYEQLGWRCVGRRAATWSTRDGSHPLVRLFIAPTG